MQITVGDVLFRCRVVENLLIIEWADGRTARVCDGRFGVGGLASRRAESSTGEVLGVFNFVGEPVWHCGGCLLVVAVVQLGAGRHGGEEEGHAIVVQGRAPLAHGIVGGVEDAGGVLAGGI